MTSAWTNESAIGRWNTTTTREQMDSTAEEGDFAKRHLVNPDLLRLLGEVSGQRILDAGCGNGYFSRMLAERGAHVVGVEPANSMVTYARNKETELRQGITYLEADLSRQPDLGDPFDAVVCSMVLMAIPNWKPAMRTCVESLRPGGLFVFAVVHPAFEQLWTTWRAHGEYRTQRYLEEYEIPGLSAPDFHRPISAYLNELTALGCHLREIAEPGLDPAEATRTPTPGLESYVHLPNFLIVSSETPA